MTLKLDPIGYFIIRPNREKKEVEIAFCHYKAEKGWYKNTVEMKKCGKTVKELMDWINEHKIISVESHIEYMKKEMQRCFECIESGEEYVQD